MLLAGAACLLPRRAAAADAIAPLALSVAVASTATDHGPRAVVDDAFIEHQLARANEIFGEHGLAFTQDGAVRTLSQDHAELESRADRDALAAESVAKRINVYYVRSLRDVDDPSLHRMGVTWRKLTDLKKRFLIIASTSLPTTLAHELGHFLGNDHSSVRNNLMSYARDDESTHPHVFLDAAQGARARRAAIAARARGEIAP